MKAATLDPHALIEPGHTSRKTHIGLYVLLVILLGVDYVLLSQALILLNARLSETGSIGLAMYVITGGVSCMMLAVPHALGFVVRRIADGLLSPQWYRVVYASGVLWAGILALLTVMRIRGAWEGRSGSALEGLDGVEAAVPAFDVADPDTLMAFLTVFILTTTGLIGFLIVYFTYRPLRTAVDRAQRIEDAWRSARDAAVTDVVLKEGTLESAQNAVVLDLEKLRSAKGVFSERLMELRADIGAQIAESQGDPEATSSIIRELLAHREARELGSGGLQTTSAEWENASSPTQ